MDNKHNNTNKDYKDVIKAETGTFAYFVTARWANRMLPWAVEKGFSPNQVTAVSLVLSVFVALCFAHGSRWIALIGSFIMIFAFVLDCLDGQLARYTRKITPFGIWLDIFGDRVREMVVWACLCVGYSRRTGETEVWMWGMFCVIVYSLRFAEGLYRERAIARREGEPKTIGEGGDAPIRVWIQRILYFGIGERVLLFAIAAPTGLVILSFQIITLSSLIMMILFSIQGWYRVRKEAFTVKNKGS